MSADGPDAVRRGPVFTLGMVFDLIAALGLCLVAVGAFVRGDALGLIFLGGTAGLAAIPGAVLSGIALRRAARQRGWPRGRFVMTVTGLALAAACIGPAVLTIGWNATPNPAEDAAAPFERELRSVGGTALCTDGDPGVGPDNVTPWHEGYFTVPDDRASAQQLERLARSAGFTGLRRVTDRASSFSDSQRFALDSAATDRPRAALSVEVSPTGTQLDCGAPYGRTYRPADHRVVVDLTTTIAPAP